jgi:FdhD protein
MRPFRTIPSWKLETDRLVEEDEVVAIETALELRLKDKFVAAFVCSPGQEKELAVGFLLSSGIVSSPDDVSDVQFSNHRVHVEMKDGAEFDLNQDISRIRRIVTTECSAPEILKDLRTGGRLPRVERSVSFPLDSLERAAVRIRESQVIRKRTGATHAAMVYQPEQDREIIVEDLGRHTAADKAIGGAVLDGFDLSESLLFTTGRLTADIVGKCSWSSIPLLVSYAVATDAGVNFARRANVTLVGSFRGKRRRLYHSGAATIAFR